MENRVMIRKVFSSSFDKVASILFLLLVLIILLLFEGRQENLGLGLLLLSAFVFFYTKVLLNGLRDKEFIYSDTTIKKEKSLFWYYFGVVSSIVAICLSIFGIILILHKF